MNTAQLLLFREDFDSGTNPVTRDESATETEDWLICRACARPVTKDRDRIAVDGRHRHNLFNPAGILFEVGCFAAAPGCRFSGEFTEEFTWFPGHAWRYALCGGCGEHLGWEFRSQDSGFAGLILGKVIPLPK
jgi:hypothetical protein